MSFEGCARIVDQAIGRVAPAAVVAVRREGQVAWLKAAGWLDPETQAHPVQIDTLFDLASVTKLFVATAFMTLVEEKKVGLDQAVSTVLPEFCGIRTIQPYEDPLKWGQAVQPLEEVGLTVDASTVTFRQLLAHNSGLPAWRPLKDQENPDAAIQMVLHTGFFYPPGTRSVYSDIGLILLGLSIQKLTGMRLDEVVSERVIKPSGLHHTRYLPNAGQPYDTSNIAPTEFCTWRSRRVIGEVHDENAARLGGVAGHAGLFSCALDLAAFGQVYLDHGSPLLRRETVLEMTRLQIQDGSIRRGIGFALWSPDPEASSNPFHQSAFGHTGFTGTSLWIDPHRQLVVAVLTNRVFYGRDAQEISRFRVELHSAIVAEVDRCE